MFKVNAAVARTALFKSGLSLVNFAKKVGLNVLTVKRAINGKELTAKAISKLSAASGIDAQEFIKE